MCGLAVLHSFSPPLIHGDLRAPHVFLTRNISPDISEDEINSNTFVKIGNFRNSEFIFHDIQRDDTLRVSRNFTSFTLAPEVIQKQLYTTKSDVYSLGLLLWQLRYRVPIFESLSQKEGNLCDAIVQGERPPLQFHDDYDELITFCWRSNPLFRPTVSDVHVTLRTMASAYCPDLAECLPILDQSLPNSSEKEVSLPDTFIESTTIPIGQGVTSLSYTRSKSTLPPQSKDSPNTSFPMENEISKKGKGGKSSRISCSALGDSFLWFGCTNGTIGCLSTRQKDLLPIYVDDSLLSEQRPSVTAMAYISSTHTIWTSNNSMDLQVWDATPMRGLDEGERMRHSDMVEVSRKSFMRSKEENVRLTLIGGKMEWQTSKTFHSISLENVMSVSVTPNPARLVVTTLDGETYLFKTNEAESWAVTLQRCMWCYDQKWIITKIAEWKKDRVDVKGPGYIVTSLQAIDGNAWSFDGSLFLKEWKIQTTQQQSHSLKSLEVSRLIRLDVNPKDMKCQILPNMILHVTPDEMWACVSDRFFRVQIRTYLSSQPLLEQGAPVLDPQGKDGGREREREYWMSECVCVCEGIELLFW